MVESCLLLPSPLVLTDPFFCAGLEPTLKTSPVFAPHSVHEAEQAITSDRLLDCVIEFPDVVRALQLMRSDTTTTAVPPCSSPRLPLFTILRNLVQDGGAAWGVGARPLRAAVVWREAGAAGGAEPQEARARCRLTAGWGRRSDGAHLPPSLLAIVVFAGLSC